VLRQTKLFRTAARKRVTVLTLLFVFEPDEDQNGSPLLRTAVSNKSTTLVERVAAIGLRRSSGTSDSTIEHGTFRDFVSPAKAGVQSLDAVGNLHLMRGCLDSPKRLPEALVHWTPACAGETNRFGCAHHSLKRRRLGAQANKIIPDSGAKAGNRFDFAVCFRA
ncbi:MAG: hypothetical protein WAV67_11125, partial [Dokdonella sp.]